LAGVTAQLKAAGVKRLAFESETTTYQSFETLKTKLRGIKLKPRSRPSPVAGRQGQVGNRRHRPRCGAHGRSLVETVASLRAGVTEREVALDLDRAALLSGAEAIAFPTIVAFGPSAAHPHAVPGARASNPGQVVKIDCGAKVDGYCSDITRTYVFGDADEKTKEVYTAVYDAQAAALKAARAGMKGAELDSVARNIIAERGYGDNFGHGLGHGVACRSTSCRGSAPERGRTEAGDGRHD